MASAPKRQEHSNVWRVVAVAGLGGALLVPGLDILAAPALVALLVSFAGGKK